MMNFEKIAGKTKDAYDSFRHRGFSVEESVVFVEKMLPDIIYDVEKEEINGFTTGERGLKADEYDTKSDQ